MDKCFFDSEPCPIRLKATCHHCQRFNNHHINSLPRLGKVERSLLIEAKEFNHIDYSYLSKSQKSSRRRAMSKLKEHGLVIKVFADDLSRILPELTPLGETILLHILPLIRADKPIRWQKIKPLIKGVGSNMNEMKNTAASFCQKEIDRGYDTLTTLIKHGISAKDEIYVELKERIYFYESKFKALDVAPSEKIN